jgi:hypothetical protein
MLKTMIIVGLEKLENITEHKSYQIGDIEKRLYPNPQTSAGHTLGRVI